MYLCIISVWRYAISARLINAMFMCFILPFCSVEIGRLENLIEAAVCPHPTMQQLELLLEGMLPHQAAAVLRYGLAYGTGIITAEKLVKVRPEPGHI